MQAKPSCLFQRLLGGKGGGGMEAIPIQHPRNYSLGNVWLKHYIEMKTLWARALSFSGGGSKTVSRGSLGKPASGATKSLTKNPPPSINRGLSL